MHICSSENVFDLYDVFLNGTRMQNVMEADTGKGVVVICDRAHAKSTYNNKYMVWTYERKGKVELVHKLSGAVVQ